MLPRTHSSVKNSVDKFPLAKKS